MYGYCNAFECISCKYAYTIIDCYPNRSTDTEFCEGFLDTFESTLKEWAGSGLLTNDEAKTIILKHCSPETRPNDIIITEIERDLIEAQALKTKLEYEGKIQKLKNKIKQLKESMEEG
jgi:hypothetical protein